MYRILIVEDDETISSSLCRLLAAWGYEPHAAVDFGDVMREFAAHDPHLVLLDISLPRFSGYHWCGEIRRASRVPVVFLSSAGDAMNIVTAMTLGADDFIAKPFDPAVLQAKLQALLRRAYDYSEAPQMLEHRGARLSRTDSVLTCGDTQVTLTRNEYRILLTLMERPGRIVSRELLMQRLWETDSFVDENTLSVNVARLRKKLAPLGLEDMIATRKGLGYILL